MTSRRIRLLRAAVVTVAAALVPAVAGDYGLQWRTIDGGGGTSSGGAFSLSGTIGQPDAGAMTGGAFALAGGFWHAGAAAPCAGDVDGSGVVDFGDILAILAAWGACEGCPEDLDGNGFVDFADILVVLSAWGACP